MTDDLARIRAEWDQTKEGVGDFAEVLGRFHRELLDEGLNRAEALMLCQTFLSEQIRGANNTSAVDAAIDVFRRLLGGEDDEAA